MNECNFYALKYSQVPQCPGFKSRPGYVVGFSETQLACSSNEQESWPRGHLTLCFEEQEEVNFMWQLCLGLKNGKIDLKICKKCYKIFAVRMKWVNMGFYIYFLYQNAISHLYIFNIISLNNQTVC